MAGFDPNQPRDEIGRWTVAGMAARKAAGLPQDTMQIYCDENGNWTAERQKLHEEIIESFFKGKTPVENPKVIVLGGGPGAGKSTIARNNLDLDENTVYVDSDAIKYMLPEMREGIKKGDLSAAAYVHEESSYLAKKISARASKENYNLLMDGTGDDTIENLTRKISSLRSKNNSIEAVYVTIDANIAWERSLKRAVETGRYVPKAVLFSSHKAISNTFPLAIERGLFDNFKLFDNGYSEPKLIAQGKGSVLEILDKEAWSRFLKKGQE